jgi:hypothetical protein
LHKEGIGIRDRKFGKPGSRSGIFSSSIYPGSGFGIKSRENPVPEKSRSKKGGIPPGIRDFEKLKSTLNKIIKKCFKIIYNEIVACNYLLIGQSSLDWKIFIIFHDNFPIVKIFLDFGL